MENISSVQNPKIKEIIKLRKTNARRKRGLIVIEGKKEIEMATISGLNPETLFFCPEFKPEHEQPKIDEKKVVILTRAVFKKISYRENPDGYLALAKPKPQKFEKIKLSKNPLILVLESVEKPGNLGAILRTAEAAGIDAVLLCDQTTDLFNPNVIRASRGTVFSVQFLASTTEKIQNWLKKHKFKIITATPDADKIYTDVSYNEPVAIVIGSEHSGLNKKWLEKADAKIKIPMNGKIDSLNASVSAAVVVFEAVRQRGF